MTLFRTTASWNLNRYLPQFTLAWIYLEIFPNHVMCLLEINSSWMGDASSHCLPSLLQRLTSKLPLTENLPCACLATMRPWVQTPITPTALTPSMWGSHGWVLPSDYNYFMCYLERNNSCITIVSLVTLDYYLKYFYYLTFYIMYCPKNIGSFWSRRSSYVFVTLQFEIYNIIKNCIN
jgi:hypothetical protein